MSIPALPGTLRLGDKVQQFATSRGMRQLHSHEVEQLNAMSETDAAAALEGYRRVQSCAGILARYFETEQPCQS